MAARKIIAQSPIVGVPPNSITCNKSQFFLNSKGKVEERIANSYVKKSVQYS